MSTEPQTSPAFNPPSGSELRQQLTDKLHDEGAHDLAEKLERCAETMRISCTGCGHTKQVETRCKQRWCPVCAVKLSMQRITRYEQAAGRAQWPLMLTLTCTNTHDAQEAATRIQKAFTKFRRTAWWRKLVKGGVASYECTERGKGWHPHLHCLLDARWLSVHTQEPKRTDNTDERTRKQRSAQRELSQQWAAAIGQREAIVHVRRAFGESLKEALKYNLKPTDLINNAGRISPLLRALKGKRLVIPFGSFYDLSAEWKDQEAEKKTACKCIECGKSGTYLPDAVIHLLRTRNTSKHHYTGSSGHSPTPPPTHTTTA